MAGKPLKKQKGIQHNVLGKVNMVKINREEDKRTVGAAKYRFVMIQEKKV